MKLISVCFDANFMLQIYNFFLIYLGVINCEGCCRC